MEILGFFGDIFLRLASALKLGDYYLADWLFLVMLMTAVFCLYKGHRNKDVDLWDVVRAKKNEEVFTDPRKLFEAGAFVVMTVGFAHMTIQGKLTEWYAMIYVAAWVAARAIRDREQRLNKALDLGLTPNTSQANQPGSPQAAPAAGAGGQGGPGGPGVSP